MYLLEQAWLLLVVPSLNSNTSYYIYKITKYHTNFPIKLLITLIQANDPNDPNNPDSTPVEFSPCVIPVNNVEFPNRPPRESTKIDNIGISAVKRICLSTFS